MRPEDLAHAAAADQADPLRTCREQFLFPKLRGEPVVYLAGNSLGLQPLKARGYIEQELEDWERHGVEGHLQARRPWLPYHEQLTEQVATLVGAKPIEVVVMNTLTVNLHLMLVSFYRPTVSRFKILMEAGAFPSDQYAVASQVRFHGHSAANAIVEVAPRPGEHSLREADLRAVIEREGAQLALVLIGNVNYLTGQAFDMVALTEIAHRQGALIGFDLAHGAGNLQIDLHAANPDFAVWCSYKYLNGGPGSLAGCFVHERHARTPGLPRFEGWWGHNKQTRFEMPHAFDPLPGAEGWQLSNPPIFQLAALRASIELFAAAGMRALRRKSEALTGYLETLLGRLPPGFCTQLTPSDPAQRGAQLSLRFKGDPHRLLAELSEAGVICDFRAPDVIRVAPAPLYCSFRDVSRFALALEAHGHAA